MSSFAAPKAHAGLFDFLFPPNSPLDPLLDFVHDSVTGLFRLPHDESRRKDARFLRKDFADLFWQEGRDQDDQLASGDEPNLAQEHYYASFTKGLPCNTFGEVDPQAFEALAHAMSTGISDDFDQIPLDPGAARRLANPQGAFKFAMSSIDAHDTRILPSHSIHGARLAGELVEVYWQALLRDVSFEDYASDPQVQLAVSELNGLSEPLTPSGSVTATSLFRGETSGDLIGPYISQFLWQPIPFGPKTIEQRYPAPLPGIDFMVQPSQGPGSWLAIQRGAAPASQIQFQSTERYIHNSRTLASFVHQDFSYQAYLQAALVLLGYGASALPSANPYSGNLSPNQGPFVSHGGPFVLDLVARAANLALAGAWFQKWRVHRLLRPECMAGRAHFLATGERSSYSLHADLMNSQALAATFTKNGTYLLPQAYPEGSPMHPSYPAGHACVAGACVTVLKAVFDENFQLPNPVVATQQGQSLAPYQGAPLLVGNELNKLANNISLGRDAAGVHYRQDGIQGLLLGEQVAIALLREESSTMSELGFDGFRFKNFSGATVEIFDGFL